MTRTGNRKPDEGTLVALLQPPVFGLRLPESGDARVGAWPESAEAFPGSARAGLVAGKCPCPAETQMNQRADDVVEDNSGLIQDLLELRGGGHGR